MKIQHLLSIVFAAGILGLSFSTIAHAGEPIEGVEINLQKNPGGSITATTNSDGSFTFGKLEPGQYTLFVVPQSGERSVAYSNYDRDPGPIDSVVAADGSTVVKVTLDFLVTGEKKPFIPIKLTIGPKGGSVSGTAALLLAAGGAAAAALTVTPADLGVDTIGILPTHAFYVFKQLGRTIECTLTTDPVAKAELELKITNQVAAEVLGVEQAYDACAANALGGGKLCDPEEIGGALSSALRHFTNAQKRLVASLSALTDTSKNPKVAKLLVDVDSKTATHAALLDQLDREHASNPEYRSESMITDPDHHYIVATFTAAGEKSANMKQKATAEIAHADTAIKKAETTVFGQPVTFTASSKNDGEARPLTIVIGLAPIAGGDQTYTNPYYIQAPSPTGGNPTGPPTLNDPIPGIDIVVCRGCGIPATVSSGTDGSFSFTGLAPGAYDLSAAGQAATKATVGADGTLSGKVLYANNHGEFGDYVWGTHQNATGTFNGLMIGARAAVNDADGLISVTTTAGLAIGQLIRIDNEWMQVTALAQTSITVLRGANGSTPGAHLNGATIYRFWTPIPSFIVLVNTKGNLASAKTAFAAGKYGEAYGLARSAEARVAGIWADTDIDKTTDTPVPKAPPPVVSSTPEKTAPPQPSVSEPPVSSVPPPVSSTPGRTETPPPSTRTP